MSSSDLFRSLVSELTGVTPRVAEVTSHPDAADPAGAPAGDPVRIVRREELAKARGTLTQVDYQQRLRSGEWRDQRREIYDNGDSAVLLPYDRARRTVLLTRQFRLPPFVKEHAPALLEACAGKLDDEAAEVRIIKEAEEELGLRVTAPERLFSLYMTPAAVAEKITFFLCDYTPADRLTSGGGLAEEGEFIDVVELELGTAAGMILTGEIQDAKTVILIQALVARHGGAGGISAAGPDA
jgi:nudix-type nucleoside diphosphatase (YffH/AdpP family)